MIISALGGYRRTYTLDCHAELVSASVLVSLFFRDPETSSG